MSNHQPNAIPEAVLRELAPHGALRAAINLGNSVLAQRQPNEEKLTGVSVDLADALGRQLGVPVEHVIFDAAGKVFEALAEHRWDVAFLAIDPTRGEQIAFTPPYVLIEGAYLVRADDNRFQCSADLDRHGVRISVGNASAYALFLGRTLEHASLESHLTGHDAFTAFLQSDLDATAGIRQVVEAYAANNPELRVIDDSFMTIRQAIGVPKAHSAALAFVTGFIAAQKTQGRIADSLERSGQSAAKVAP
ncbi:transporter substrate-binding domain-containing protein [Paraburkholderia sp.]|uniref:transporter substrate-binding domain-containing protein n=1 Tax=Paraburkholderia sp. TaxID=1926495 RepID=UPI0023982487|nr:transporter substrate-binding domain-containing protein [Paraburkholderia sp.]MDE1182312.1 transporter substrate-binding domain-containing protein [Paraburkholderia sp.]